jgi:hypothetical protein
VWATPFPRECLGVRRGPGVRQRVVDQVFALADLFVRQLQIGAFESRNDRFPMLMPRGMRPENHLIEPSSMPGASLDRGTEKIALCSVSHLGRDIGSRHLGHRAIVSHLHQLEVPFKSGRPII